MEIQVNNLKRQYELFQEEYDEKIISTLRSGWYILGEEVKAFEKEFSKYLGVNHCVGLANGLDALWLAFRVLGIKEGDEVIVCANAYIACVMGFTMNGLNATPIFVEPDVYDNIDADKIESVITDKTKAILVVHLYGMSCDMDKIMDISNKYNLKVVEDCAQSHGTYYKGKMLGSFGEISCFSFYPSKGCGAFGDAGAIVTNNEKLAKKIKILRNYGSEIRYYNNVIGINSRLDEIQAALLRVKLTHLDEMNKERCKIAENYNSRITLEILKKPKVRPNTTSTWHQYVVHVKEDKRDKFSEYLKSKGIGTLIHYPIPPHLSEAYNYLGYKQGDLPITERYAEEILSLPIYNGMTNEEIDYVINTINDFKE